MSTSTQENHYETSGDESLIYLGPTRTPDNSTVGATTEIEFSTTETPILSNPQAHEHGSFVQQPIGPTPSPDDAIARLLVSTKRLLEAFNQWSRGELTNDGLSKVYVWMGNDFNSAMVEFQAKGIDISKFQELLTSSSQTELFSSENALGSIASDEGITSTMNIMDIILRLAAHGCMDMTDQLDLPMCGNFPTSHGGFGNIYQGTLRDGTTVAIKTIRLFHSSYEENEKYLKHAARELYTWSKCKHPNVQQLAGLASFRGQLGMISRWEPNGNLPQYLARHTRVDRYRISVQVVDGLLYLHSSGVIHGDLKGTNILISENGAPLLTDFGNADLRQYTLHFTTTSSQAAISTRWAAPEILQGITMRSEPADVYALGMTMLEIFTGAVPYAEKVDTAVMFAVAIAKACPERPEIHIPRNSEHGDKLWSLLKRCWEFLPEDRPNVSEVKGIVETINQEGLESGTLDMAKAAKTQPVIELVQEDDEDYTRTGYAYWYS